VAIGVLPSESAPELTRLLTDLLQLQRELVEERLLRRTDGLQRARDAVSRLGELGSPAGVIGRAAQELGESSDLDRVVISRVEDGALVPLIAWSADEDAHAGGVLGRSMPLAYPLIEAEVAQRHEATIVSVGGSGARSQPELREALGCEKYVVAAIRIEGSTAGLLHAGRVGDASPVDDIDLAVATLYADGLGQAFERAVLRETLQRQRRQLSSAARWISAQTARLATDELPGSAPDVQLDDSELLELLTPREREVLRLIARGLSNSAIAQALMLGEGTIKYHVKNILRKLQARSRTEAVSRLMRLESFDG
jgi:DNA-binding CsgD family transcriptional regulator